MVRNGCLGSPCEGLLGCAGCGQWGGQGCVCPCRYRRRKQSCPSCHYSWCEDLRDEEMTLRKVEAGRGGPRLTLGTVTRGLAGSRGWRSHKHPFPVQEVWGGGWLDLAPVLTAPKAAVSF